MLMLLDKKKCPPAFQHGGLSLGSSDCNTYWQHPAIYVIIIEVIYEMFHIPYQAGWSKKAPEVITSFPN